MSLWRVRILSKWQEFVYSAHSKLSSFVSRYYLEAHHSNPAGQGRARIGVKSYTDTPFGSYQSIDAVNAVQAVEIKSTVREEIQVSNQK
jgi:hypothetical protein